MPDIVSPQNQPTSPLTPPTPSGVLINGNAAPPPPVISPTPVVMPEKSRKKLWLGFSVIILVLAIAASYVFGLYLPNTPTNVYNTSLKNSGQAIDRLVAYSKTQEQTDYKSASLDGTINVKSPSASFDFSTNGSFDKTGNANFDLKADILGEKMNASLRSISTDGKTPDLYFQIQNIKNLLDSAGLSTLDTLDGQWIVVDHTLLDTYLSTLEQSVPSTQTDIANLTTTPTADQAQDALDKVQAVNKQYIFTADPQKAVLTDAKFIASETQNGRPANHYKVGYNKTRLEAYVKAVGQALDSSKLNDWSKKANDGKSLSQTVDIESLEDRVKNAKSDYTFDLWADTKTKLVAKVAFTDPSDTSSIFAITQGYTGGSQYPFTFDITGKDGGNLDKGSLSINLDTSTNKTTITFSFDGKDSDGTTTVRATFHAAPSNETVKVTAPTGAKPINDILSELGLNDLMSSSEPDLSALLL